MRDQWEWFPETGESYYTIVLDPRKNPRVIMDWRDWYHNRSQFSVNVFKTREEAEKAKSLISKILRKKKNEPRRKES